MAIDLRGIRLKVERAKQHTSDMDKLIEEFIAGEPYSFFADKDPESEDRIIRIKVLKDPPQMIGVILGDIIHNLRSALDHLACQFVIHNNGIPTKSTAFPIVENDPKTDKNTKRYWKGCTAGMSDEVKALIDAAQPYHRLYGSERYIISFLGELSNWDKHHDIHTVGHLLRGSGFEGIGGGNIGIIEAQPGSPLKDGAEVYRIIPRSSNAFEIPMNMKIQIAAGIAVANTSNPMLDGIDPHDIASKLIAYIGDQIVGFVAKNFPLLD